MGLFLTWNNNVTINIRDSNNNYADVYTIFNEDNNKMCRITCIYGSPNHQDKLNSFSMIKELYNTNYNENWIAFGDFNPVLINNEKKGVTRLTIT